MEQHQSFKQWHSRNFVNKDKVTSTLSCTQPLLITLQCHFPSPRQTCFLKWKTFTSQFSTRDYKVSACAGTGETANRLYPSIPSMESNSSSPTHRPAPGTPSNKLPEQEFCGKCPDNLFSPESTKQKRNSIKENENQGLRQDKESQSVDDQIISQKKEPKTAIFSENKASQALKTQHTTKYQSSAPKKAPSPTTTKDTKELNLPKREIRAPEKPQPKLESQRMQPLFPKKSIEGPVIPQRNESQSKTKSRFLESAINQSSSSWNALNETSSSSSEEEKPPFKTGDICDSPILQTNQSSIGLSEQPVYLHPPKLEFPEDDAHFYYYPSDYPTYSHLQIICASYKRTPINKLVIESLEYHEYQKSNLIQRELTAGANIRNIPSIHHDIIKYAEFYHDYDPKALENQSKKPYLMIDRNNPNTVLKSKRGGQQTRN